MLEQASTTDPSSIIIHLNEKYAFERSRHKVCCGVTARGILKLSETDENKKYFDALALSYTNELGALFDKNNGSLPGKPTTAALIRAKTISVIGQWEQFAVL